MIEMRDGSFTLPEEWPKAMEIFPKLVESGAAKALYVGTLAELEKVKDRRSIEDRLTTLEKDVAEMRPLTSDIIIIPNRGVKNGLR